jgi:hypothetical protein
MLTPWEAGTAPWTIWAFWSREKPLVAAGVRTSDHSAGAKLKYASITFVGLSLTKPAVRTELIFTHSLEN